jgi:uncharacterized protein YjbJ (UPF0337 family)
LDVVGLYALATESKQEPSKMDENRIVGATKQAKGASKEATGKIVGDAELAPEGKNDNVVGKIQNAIGGASDSVREAAKK